MKQQSLRSIIEVEVSQQKIAQLNILQNRKI